MADKRLSQMQIEVDTHTHTILSGHAWSTLQENAAAAAQIGLKKFVCTEHSYKLPHSAPWFISFSFDLMPEKIGEVGLVMGMEYNILDFAGSMDIEDSRRDKVKFGIASMHDVVTKPGTALQHTDAYIAALADPLIDVIGHPGNPTFPVHIEEVVLCAKRFNKMIEINNHSSNVRKGSRDNCREFARLCKKHDVRVCVASDAHYSSSVGNVPYAMALLEEADFPADLIVNLYEDRFDRYLEERRLRQCAANL